MNSSLTERLLDAATSLTQAAAPEPETLPAPARAALEALAAGAALPLKAVAEAAGIAKSTASGLVDGLCGQGLVQRERDAADARRLALRITPAGRLALAESSARTTARLAAAIARLPEGDAEELARLAEALVALLDGGTVAPAPAPAAAPPPLPTTAPAAPLAAHPAPAPAPGPGAALRLLVVQLDGGAYAVPVEAVREVLPYRAPRSLASPSPWLDGVVSVRGELLAVSDLRRTVGLPSGGPVPEALVVALGPAGPVGLAVDRVRELRTVHQAALQPPVAGAAPAIAGIAEVDGELLFVLDLAVLLAG